VTILTTSWRNRRVENEYPPFGRSAARERRRAARANAAVAKDVFMDIVVLLSVIIFIALIAGIGLLALQTAFLHWPN